MRSSAVFVLLALVAISSAFEVYYVQRDLVKRSLKTRDLSQACIEILQPCFAMTPDFGIDDSNLLQKSCDASRAFYACIETSGQFCDGNDVQTTLAQMKEHIDANCPPQWSGLNLRKTFGFFKTILGVSQIADGVDIYLSSSVRRLKFITINKDSVIFLSITAWTLWS